MTKKRSSERRVVSYLTKQQREFLEIVIGEDAAESPNGAVKWCIDSCIAVEKTYGMDALNVGLNDVREELKKQVEQLEAWKQDQLKIWGPIMDFMQDNSERFGLTIGDSMSKKVLEILNERIAK